MYMYSTNGLKIEVAVSLHSLSARLMVDLTDTPFRH